MTDIALPDASPRDREVQAVAVLTAQRLGSMMSGG